MIEYALCASAQSGCKSLKMGLGVEPIDITTLFYSFKLKSRAMKIKIPEWFIRNFLYKADKPILIQQNKLLRMLMTDDQLFGSVNRAINQERTKRNAITQIQRVYYCCTCTCNRYLALN